MQINGITGTLAVLQDDIAGDSCKYIFCRAQAGDAVVVAKGTRVKIASAGKYTDYITIVFMGQNGGYDQVDELIKQQKAILSTLALHQNDYIIMGLSSGTAAEREMMDARLQQEYGDRFFNPRIYLCEHGMQAAGLTPTENDKQQLATGAVPDSLRVDAVHLNALAYTALGKGLFARMEQLGYFDCIAADVCDLHAHP